METLLTYLENKRNFSKPDLEVLKITLHENWYDTFELIERMQFKDFKRMGFKEEVAQAILEGVAEANKPISYSYKYDWNPKDYNYAKKTESFSHKEDIYSSSSDNNTSEKHKNSKSEVVVYGKSASQKNTCEGFIDQYVKQVNNTEKCLRGLKKLKFLLVKIQNQPDIEDFRQINRNDPDLVKLLFDYPIIYELFSYLGFVLHRNSMLYLEKERACSEMINETIKTIQKAKELLLGDNPVNVPNQSAKVMTSAYLEKLIKSYKSLYQLDFAPFVKREDTGLEDEFFYNEEEMNVNEDLNKAQKENLLKMNLMARKLKSRNAKSQASSFVKSTYMSCQVDAARFSFDIAIKEFENYDFFEVSLTNNYKLFKSYLEKYREEIIVQTSDKNRLLTIKISPFEEVGILLEIINIHLGFSSSNYTLMNDQNEFLNENASQKEPIQKHFANLIVTLIEKS